MNKSFWTSKWKKNEIGFHQASFNPIMVEFFKEKDLKGKTVFVPLCGKTNDMLYFAERGARVIGCEFLKEALTAFLEENQIEHIVEKTPEGTWSRGGGFELFEGDYFDLKINTPPDFIYDRASMVALPPDTRVKYAKKMSELAGPNSKMLLITFDYDQSLMEGPPFSVGEDEVKIAYKKAQVRLIKNVEEKRAKFKSATLDLSHLVFEVLF
jgi:thiopurine S-methyltransferase